MVVVWELSVIVTVPDPGTNDPPDFVKLPESVILLGALNVPAL